MIGFAVLIHSIALLIKIFVLGCLYATLILLLFKMIGHFNEDSWFTKVSKRKLRLFFISGFSISVGLFLYASSYWGDTGLGDFSRIPIGHFKDVRNIDDNSTYIENEKGDQLNIQEFTYDDNNLYAKTKRDSVIWGSRTDYVVWDLRTDEWKFYNSQKDYLAASKGNNYPEPAKFEEFWDNYNKHWSGWKNWFLP